jgi:hypothetical protein
MRRRSRDEDGPQVTDLAPISMFVLMASLFGAGIYYLAARVHAPEQSRMIDVGPPD